MYPRSQILQALPVVAQTKPEQGPNPYENDPVRYAREKLHVEPTDAQQEIARAIQEPPYRVKVPSGHNVGKTFLAAWLVNWWYDTWDPSCVITTAPTEKDVIDLLWAEVRLQRIRAGLPAQFIGPRAPEMRTSEDHYAKGYTARLGQSFQGRHRSRMLFVFDEDEGVDAAYWEAASTMFKPEAGHAWLCIGNPTTNTSQSAIEELSTDSDGNPTWRIIRLSALDHPNIREQLAGREPLIPNAVTISQVKSWVSDWCDQIKAEEATATDFEFPPSSGQWYRPGPIGESRILGRRPSAGTYGVWSDALFNAACSLFLEIPPDTLPEIGCDVARYGDDYTAWHVRCGPVSLQHDRANGWSVVQTAGRLQQLAREYAAWLTARRDKAAEPIKPQQIPIKVDDDGVGGGVTDILKAAGFTAIAVNAGSSPRKTADYPNRRSELWFDVANLARRNLLSFARLDKKTQQRLRQQALAPAWELDVKGRRVIESKKKTKEEKLDGHSPDDMDALNLAYAPNGSGEAAQGVQSERQRHEPGRESAAERRGLYGR